MASLAVIGEGLIELELGSLPAQLRFGSGGDAANVAVMAARLGCPARLAGRVGADPFGEWLLAFWRNSGVNLESVRIDPQAPTGLYLNAATGSGEHRFVYWRGGSAGSRLAHADLDEDFLAGAAILAITGVTLAISRRSAQTALRAIERARERGTRIACVLNHRPALGGEVAALADLAAAADIVIGSREDALAVFGEQAPEQLRREGVRAAELVITAGGEPVRAIAEGVALEQPVPATEVVNAAGAGDAFAGAYLASRIAGRSPSQALTWGVAAAACSVSRRGCASSYPSLTEVEACAGRLPALA